MQEEEHKRDEDFLDGKHRDKKGTIIIEFYRTEAFERRNRPNQVHAKRYDEHFVQDSNKKSSFADTVRIKEGKEFTLPARKRDGKFEDKRFMTDYKIDYQQVIDSITIHYADWSFLQLMNMVDIRNYDHLKLVPQSLMSSIEFITKVLWTIVRELGKIHFS